MSGISGSDLLGQFTKLSEAVGEEAAASNLRIIYSLDEAAFNGLLADGRKEAFGDAGDLVGGLVHVLTFAGSVKDDKGNATLPKREDMPESFQRPLFIARNQANAALGRIKFALETISKVKGLAEGDDGLATQGLKFTPMEKVQATGNLKPLKGIEGGNVDEALIARITGPEAEAYLNGLNAVLTAMTQIDLTPWDGLPAIAGEALNEILDAEAEAEAEQDDDEAEAE